MELPLLIVDKPLVCQRGLPGRLSSHCAAVGGPVFRRCALRVLAPSALRASDGQRPVRESIFPFRTVPQFSMVVPLRSQARLWHSLLHWAYSALFRAQRARFVRPSPSAGRCSVSSHRPALRLRGVPALRPPFGRVLAPPAASRPSIAHYASPRVLGTSALRAFTFLQGICSRKIPEMTYTPSFLIKASFFRYFVNALSAPMRAASA